MLTGFLSKHLARNTNLHISSSLGLALGISTVFLRPHFVVLLSASSICLRVPECVWALQTWDRIGTSSVNWSVSLFIYWLWIWWSKPASNASPKIWCNNNQLTKVSQKLWHHPPCILVSHRTHGDSYAIYSSVPDESHIALPVHHCRCIKVLVVYFHPYRKLYFYSIWRTGLLINFDTTKQENTVQNLSMSVKVRFYFKSIAVVYNSRSTDHVFNIFQPFLRTETLCISQCL